MFTISPHTSFAVRKDEGERRKERVRKEAERGARKERMEAWGPLFHNESNSHSHAEFCLGESSPGEVAKQPQPFAKWMLHLVVSYLPPSPSLPPLPSAPESI